MRKRNWLAGLLSGWLSVVGGQAFAQLPPSPGQGMASNPDAPGMLPTPYTMNYGTYPEAYTGMQAGYPPGATAYPNISPYTMQGIHQTTNENGVWFNNWINGPRKYYFSAEALMGYTNHPNSTVGGYNVNVIPNSALTPGSLGSQFPDNTSQFQQTPSGTSTIGTPDRELSAAGGGGNGGNVNGGVTGSGTPPNIPFGTQTTGEIPNNMNSTGFRGTWGWWNPDDSGLQAQMFWMGRSAATLYIGDPLGFDPVLYNDATFLQTSLLNRIHAIAGIPLSGADTDHNGLPGVVQPFDIFYRLYYQSQVGGGNLDWIAPPIFQKGVFKVRPIYGGRYIQVNEKFTFDGADSGLGYTINEPGGQSGVGGVGGGNGTTGTTTVGYLSPVTLEAATTLNVMYSLLSSSVDSQLAGPEAGFRLDLGGEFLQVWTTTKLALLANHSTRKLSGFNIGDAYYPLTNGTVTDPTAMPRNNRAATQFDERQVNTTMSPLFEQGIFGKANLFQYIPVLNRSKMFSTAEFQAGFTVIYIGNMYRPSNTIDWQAYPVNPQIADKRSTFFTSNWSFGVQWQY